jgi:hypothetical protein
MNQQDELAARIARLLDDGTAQIGPGQRERLSEARRLALSRRQSRRELVPAWAGGFSEFTERSLLGVRYVIPVAALVLGLLGVVYVNTGTVSTDMADIDAALLTDELPINAFLDQGFDSWLKRSLR